MLIEGDGGFLRHGVRGDSGRKMVVWLRLGAAPPLHRVVPRRAAGSTQGCRPAVGERVTLRLRLRHCDVCIMGDRATGCDWKNRSIVAAVLYVRGWAPS